jgi:hypothetical protein
MPTPNLLRLLLAASLFGFVGCGGATDDQGSNVAGASNAGGGFGGAVTTSGGRTGTGGGAATTPNVRQDCSSHVDCALVPASCCGTCGAPTSSDVVALRADAASAYRTDQCGAGYPCPACASINNPDLFASCENSQCVVVDLTTNPVSACSAAADCALRAARCCECGAAMDSWSLVAVSKNSESSYAALVCDASAVCAECMPNYPTSVTPTCADGHCRIDRLVVP